MTQSDAHPQGAPPLTRLLHPPERTLRHIVELQAGRLGDRPCLSVGEQALSYRELAAAAGRFGALLDEAGIGRGDRVAVMSENRWELLGLLLGCAWTGAVLVPINTASRGPQLEHILSNSEPLLVVAEAATLATIAATRRPASVAHFWSLDDVDAAIWDGLASAAMPPGSRDDLEPAPITAADPVAILYTSGTTGPSKGVVVPHGQLYWWGVVVGDALDLGPDDRLYTCLPLFHTNALTAFVQALVHDARITVGPRFSASRFWERVVAAEATVTYLLGAMVSILVARPPTETDRAHRVRIALAPATAEAHWSTMRERFGIDVVEGHGMTETNAAIGRVDGQQRPGYMGRVVPGFDARVVDEHDNPVPAGMAGELVLRANEPFAFASGYWRMPEATVEAWRNLWFHTGDRVVCDDGWYRFLDRMKDAIRRRGENISAWEVEQVLLMHDDVEAVAVVPVPSDLGEDEVLACVVPSANAVIDPVTLIAFCAARLPYFAVPRYLDVVAELPLTENGKVRKFVLRERGLTPSTWDRDAAGVEVPR
ncbi:MAG: ATP-dependent acyl-CoA ligase [Gaiellales bacterium]